HVDGRKALNRRGLPLCASRCSVVCDQRHRGVVEYKHDDYECEGFAVRGDASSKAARHSRVGEYTHKRAQMLGDLGFNAFVVDVYGRGIRPNNPETCQAAMIRPGGSIAGREKFSAGPGAPPPHTFWEYFIAQGGVPKSKFRWPSNPIRDNQ